MQAELIYYNPLTELGEGPLWDDSTQRLIWLDITRSVIHEFDPSNSDSVDHHLGRMISCLAPVKGRRFIGASQQGFGLLDLGKSRFYPIVNPERHLENNRFNDGKCDPSGNFWAGTMSMDGLKGKGNLYCLNKKGQCKRIYDSISISNGLAWNRACTTMFYIDSLAFTIRAIDFNPENGEVGASRILCTIDRKSGAFDGMTIDTDDRLWVAVYGAGEIRCIDSTSGRDLERIRVGAKKTSSCCFGGTDYNTLYITSIALEAETDDAYAGGLFAAQPGVSGLPADAYKPSFDVLDIALEKPPGTD